MALTLEGASDDLIELEGDIREEFSEDSGTLVFSNGLTVEITFDPDDSGNWRITILRQQGSCSIRYAREGEDGTDVLTIHDEVFWVVFFPRDELNPLFRNKKA